MKKLILTFIILITAGCVHTGTDPERHASLVATEAAMAKASAAGDIEAIAAFWIDDAVMYFPEAPPVEGRDSILALIRQSRSRPGFSMTWDPTRIEVARSGDLGYSSGTFESRGLDVAGQAVVREGHYMTLWQRQDDGSWKGIMESIIYSAPANE